MMIALCMPLNWHMLEFNTECTGAMRITHRIDVGKPELRWRQSDRE